MRIAGILTNDLSGPEFNTINVKLQEVTGMQQISEILDEYGLETIDDTSVLKFEKLNKSLRDSDFHFQDSKGQLIRKHTKLPLDILDIEKNLGPFTKDPDEL